MIDWPKFLQEMIERVRSEHGDAPAEVVVELARWAEENGLRHIDSGGSYSPTIPRVGSWAAPFSVFADTPRVDVQLGWLRQGNPFKIDAQQEGLPERLESLNLEGLETQTKPWFPNVGLAALEDEEARAGFLEVMGWIVSRVRGANPSPG